MPETRINAAISSDLANTISNYYVEPATTEGASGDNETIINITEWEDYYGYYKQIPELKAAIDAKARWTIGKGIKAEPATMEILDRIKGYGKDSISSILENGIKVYHIGGNFFAEIIRDKNKELVNLKPLDPSTMSIILDKKGMIKRFEQTTKTGKSKIKFNKEDIFFLPRDRVADEGKGQSLIESLKDIIDMRQEAMGDLRQVFHRFVKPKFIFHLDTDDESEISIFKDKMDNVTGKGENIYIPKDAVVPEALSVAPNSTLNPLPWIETLNNYFFQAVGVPQIILGGSSEFTEASAKIAYLAFQQTIEEEQLFIEEQVGLQLGLMIELEFPASLENELLSDKKKDGNMNIKPSEMTAGEGQ